MRYNLFPEEGTFYKANLHSHTNISDGKLSPVEMRDLYRETLGRGHGETHEDPGGSGYKSDGSGGIGSQASDHRRVDELQQHGSQLGEDGGTAQQQGQPYLLSRSERLSVPYPPQQYVLALRHSCKVSKKETDLNGNHAISPEGEAGYRRRLPGQDGP